MNLTPKRMGIITVLLSISLLILAGTIALKLTYTQTYKHTVENRPLTYSEIVTQATENSRLQKASFLDEEEAILVESETPEGKDVLIPVEKVLFQYVEITDGCGPFHEGACLNVRSGPGTEYPVVSQLRNGVVLKIDGKVERATTTWYKIVFDEWLRYPDRISHDWFIVSDYAEVLLDEGDRTIWDGNHATSTKLIIVDRSEQTLYAYENDNLFMEEKISTGLELTPTPRGNFTVFKKTPSRYMQGPLPGISNQYYDLPGVPWNLYFTHQGAVIHGAYWHNSFGKTYSHGCVNVAPRQARTLYNWADLGTKVIVRD